MLQCLIIEDEPLAADILVDYIRQLPFLHLTATCSDAVQALAHLHNEKIDLLFLDIHLPGLKGLDFLKTLRNPPAVILTTAYHEYALQGYELSVVDYLLKPIEFKRFVEAVNKVKPHTSAEKKETLTIQADKKTIVIALRDILFIESQKEYVKIQTTTQAHVSKYALSKLEEELRGTAFLRIHRSFIIALPHVKAFNAQEVELPTTTLPIGGNYREHVVQTLKAYFA